MESRLPRVMLGVALVVLVMLGARRGVAQPLGPGPGPEATSNRKVAKELVDEGNAALEDQDYERAIALYLRAFLLEPHPLLLFNLGQAYRLAGCPMRAATFYARYLARDPRGRESAAAQAALAEIQRTRLPDGAACESVATAADRRADAVVSRLKLHSAPEGMIVMLDGELVGLTPLDHRLAAGSHTIVLMDRGVRVGERTVDIAPGAITEVTIPVGRPAGDIRRHDTPRPVLLWIGGGLALAGSGVAFYLGQQGGPDHPEDPYSYEGATPAGYALAVTGAAAIGAGVWLWVRTPRRSAPVAALHPGGGYLGWQGRF